MNILRNILAVLLGGFVALMLNGVLIEVGYRVVPVDPGFDPSNPDTIKATAHLLTLGNFLMAFAAHALGSVAGGLVAGLVAATRKTLIAVIIGFLHLLGGIVAAVMIPAPVWFLILDLGVAYVPAAWLAGKLVDRKKGK
jgi:hypothetical protein